MKRLLLSSLIACATAFGLNAQVQNYTVGQTVADFTVTDVHGNTHNLSTYANAGKWIVLDFFFTACPPCQGTVPTFSEFHEKYGCNNGDVICISIDTGDDDAAVLAFEAAYSESTGFNPAPAASGTEGGGNAVVTAFGIAAFPTYCVVGPDMTLKIADIYPIANVATFETALAGEGFTPTAMSCSTNSLTENVLINDISVFPNPSTGNVSVEFNNAVSSNVTIEVSNLVGQIVYTSTETTVAGSNSFNLNLADLNDGQYIVKIGNGTTQTIAKVQISK